MEQSCRAERRAFEPLLRQKTADLPIRKDGDQRHVSFERYGTFEHDFHREGQERRDKDKQD